MPAYLLEAYVVVLGLFLLMIEAFGPQSRKDALRIVAVGGLVFGLILLFFADEPPDPARNAELARFYAADPPARFFKGIAILSTILVLLLAYDYRSVLTRFTHEASSERGTGEYYALPVFACAGMMWMASAADLVLIFVSLELVTVTFYVLVAYMRRNVGSLEAGAKYLILGALSTGFLVYGIAWIFGSAGSTNLAALSAALAPGAPLASNPTPVLFGLALVLLALAFKIGAVPMHFWIPDVYQGAPTPTTAFLSVGSKAAGFIVTWRLLTPFLDAPATRPQAIMIVLTLAGLTILIGNLAAIPQTNFKRLLAYSSIAHAGFVLLPLAAASAGTPHRLSSIAAVGFYLGTYLLMTLGVFFVLAVVRVTCGSEEIAAFNGLARRNPGLAFCTTVLLASLAGLPLTAGFFGKFFAFQLAIEAATTNVALWWGVGLGFVGVAAGFYYYLKVVRAMYWRTPATADPLDLPPLSIYAISSFTALILILGLWPQPLLWMIGA